MKVAAAGVCHSDLHLITGDWPHPAPLVLGHEGSGVVTAVVVGLPPAGQRARFDPLALAEADQRILGSNYGSAVPERDIPALVDEIMAGAVN